jgi:hypothetical protein
MWRDFFGDAGTILAVVNGLIAISIALLPARRSVYRLRLGALALVLGGLAVGATFYAKYRGYAEVQRQQTDRAELRQRLESFIAEGRDLLAQIADNRKELPNIAADQWAQRAELYLRGRLGERTVARFRADPSALYADDPAVAAPRLGYWRAVRNRVVALEAVSAEFPAQADRR